MEVGGGIGEDVRKAVWDPEDLRVLYPQVNREESLWKVFIRSPGAQWD